MKSFTRTGYIGVFLLTMATLMNEILLTRIFSVTMWYHFAFAAISIAMFGMTLGAMLVYLLPTFFKTEKTLQHLSVFSFFYGISVPLAFLSYLSVPFFGIEEWSLTDLYSIIFTYTLVAIPFIFSGISICLALTRFPHLIGKIYAADLCGAAAGCLLLVPVLELLDAPSVVCLVGLLGGLAATFFIQQSSSIRMKWGIAVGLSLCGLLTFAQIISVDQGNPLIRIKWVKGKREYPPLYEKWNSFSRIQVNGRPEQFERPEGWGFSPKIPLVERIQQLHLNIDGTAGTVLTKFDGNLQPLQYLKRDVTNLVHHLRPNSHVMVIGIGGGRDILSALVFNQKQIDGVEMNKHIIQVVNDRFGDFTGYLDQLPNVHFIHDEARSYLSRTNTQYDILQISLIDTWAATAAGAFVLAENSLYTREAWNLFLDKIGTAGILSCSRWYFMQLPGESYRLVSLATSALIDRGITQPRNHLLLVRCLNEEWVKDLGVSTLLISNTPFSSHDLEQVASLCDQYGFDLVLSPSYSSDPVFSSITSPETLDTFTQNFHINITPPTDNAPFFFNMLRWKNIFTSKYWNYGSDKVAMPESFNMKAISVLGALLITTLILTTVFIILPLFFATSPTTRKGAGPLFLYFACIGMGFMLIEISMMQRLIVFLGHPTYGLTVVLFSLLLASGIGSWVSQFFARSWYWIILGILFLAVSIFAWITPWIIGLSAHTGMPLRVLLSICLLALPGFLMGMPFPLGMQTAHRKKEDLTPWLWGINGSTSVLASVLAVVLSLTQGIQFCNLTGCACYLLATLVYCFRLRS